MNLQISIVLSIIFIFENFPPTTTTHSTDYDITEILRRSIYGIFQAVNMKEKMMQFKEKNLFDSNSSLKLGNTTATFYNELSSYGYECDPQFIIPPSLYSNFITNELRIKIPKYCAFQAGKLKDLDEFVHDVGFIMMQLINVSIEISKMAGNTKIKIVISNPEEPPDLSYYYSYAKYGYQLEKLFKWALSQRMRNKLIEYGQNTSHDLEHYTRTIFTSHSNFFDDPQRYFYLIPNIPYSCFNLRNVTIRGLTNFASLNSTHYPYYETVLLIKNIRGAMFLDYGSEIEEPMRLIFSSDDILMRVNQSSHLCDVEMQNYRVIRNHQVMGIDHNVSLTDEQSKMVMECIESALASSFTPSMIVSKSKYRIISLFELHSPLGKMIREMVNNRDWKAIKKYFNEWIPFNEDEPTRMQKVSCDNQSARSAYEYHVSFQNVSIKLISGIPNPSDIQCELPNNLKLIHQINATSIREIHCNNDKGNGININFIGNFTSINFSQIKSNSSGPNQGCEFQLNNEENIKVELVSQNHTGEEDLQLKKKIDTTLFSMAKEHFVQTVKPAVCLPYKICTQTAKVVDDFFLNLIDKVLKKCSLRKT